MSNVLIYQQGGTLYLDERLDAQPSAATVTIRTLANEALSTLGGGFTDIEAEAATCETLSLTLAETNETAKVVTVSATAGTPTTGMLDDNYRLLVETTDGRQWWPRVSGRTVSGSDVTALRFDQGVPFDIAAGSTADSVRASYAVDWSAVTATFKDRVQVTWAVTIDGVVRTYRRVYDVVKQVLEQPAEWADVLARAPELNVKTGRQNDVELWVTQAWQDVERRLFASGVRKDLIVSEGDTSLRDATVYRCLSNLAKSGIFPAQFNGDPFEYIEHADRMMDAALGQLSMFIDVDEDGALEESEEGASNLSVWWRM